MRSVLAVDDEPAATRILRLQLENAGYEVETAGDGLAALERLRERAFDVLVTDLEMPRMDGYELCQAIRDDLPERDPLIFILTGHPGAAKRRMAGLEDVELFEKPASLRALIVRIGEKLAERGEPEATP
ncbi:MAG: response regulator [Myxococcota bacterium]|nr:response regulator [Myxococcota bacterium]